MRAALLLLACLSLCLLASGCRSEGGEPPRTVDVLVLGGGTGGVAAGLAAARQGADALIVEPSPWLGGMLTAAGVSAIDGNHAMPAGIWGEFRERLYEHYGGPEAVSTGWVSNTLFEPQVGARILADMAQDEQRLQVALNTRWTDIAREGRFWVVLLDDGEDPRSVRTRQLIDATDLGDVAAAVGAAYDLGMDARAATGEPMAPAQANDIIQDLTYVAILKDYGEGANRTMEEPEGYDPDAFFCSCADRCDGSYDLPCERMLDYGLLPNGYYMINWPNAGNDFYANMVDMSEAERQEVYAAAKLHTLRFVYYIQHELGYPHLGLADDVFPTDDSLALMPYHREGRRIRGLARLHVGHLTRPFAQDDPLYRTGIAVGDYPIDHHHGQHPEAPDIDFPPVPSFSVPAGALVPEDVSDLLIADKALSVTNIVNGSSRLQPVILQIGQAAGTMAALAARQEVSPSDLSVREVQDALLAQGAYLRPYYDVKPDHPYFEPIQRIGATGLLRGTGEPYQWANRTWFYPDAPLIDSAAYQGLKAYFPGWTGQPKGDTMAFGDALDLLLTLADGEGRDEAYWAGKGSLRGEIAEWWEEGNLPQDGQAITRAQWAFLLDRLLDPFHAREVDWSGKFLPSSSGS